jgi:exonuclease III
VFTILHQNICGLPTKQEELLNSLTEHPPQIICLTEHHLHDEELDGMLLNKYILGAKFCRKTKKCGSVCIYIKDNLHFTNINMGKYSEEKDIEISALKINTPSNTTVVTTVYRLPAGDITHFLNKLETAIDQLYNNTTNIIICGDFNIDYLSDNKKKQTLNSLLTSYSLYSIIHFPTRTNNTTSTTFDNIFINKFKYEKYKVYSLDNGLSNHDAQVLSLPDTNIPDTRHELYTYRKINTHPLNEFQTI